MKYNEPYEVDPDVRNFFITLDAMKLFVDPQTGNIRKPEICATILTIFEPIIRRSSTFPYFLEGVFGPNNVIGLLVDVIYPALLKANGTAVSSTPQTPHITPLEELPKDLIHHDMTYYQILVWLFNRHEDEKLNIVSLDALRYDLHDVLPLLKAIQGYDELFAEKSDGEAVDAIINQRMENEQIAREIYIADGAKSQPKSPMFYRPDIAAFDDMNSEDQSVGIIFAHGHTFAIDKFDPKKRPMPIRDGASLIGKRGEF